MRKLITVEDLFGFAEPKSFRKVSRDGHKIKKVQKDFAFSKVNIPQIRVNIKRGNAMMPYHTIETATYAKAIDAKDYGTRRCLNYFEEFGDQYVYWATEGTYFRQFKKKEKTLKWKQAK